MDVADVDQVDIEEDNLINSDDTTADTDEDDDAGIFSIANDYTSEDENTLAKKYDDLLVLHTRLTLQQTKLMRQKISCWHEKQWSASCKTPSLTRWTGRNGMLANMEEQTFFYLMP